MTSALLKIQFFSRFARYKKHKLKFTLDSLPKNARFALKNSIFPLKYAKIYLFTFHTKNIHTSKIFTSIPETLSDVDRWFPRLWMGHRRPIKLKWMGHRSSPETTSDVDGPPPAEQAEVDGAPIYQNEQKPLIHYPPNHLNLDQNEHKLLMHYPPNHSILETSHPNLGQNGWAAAGQAS